MANRKQADIRFGTLMHHYEGELARSNDLGQYYDKTLKDLQARRQHLQNLISGVSMIKSYESYNLNYEDPSSKSITSLSNISVELNNQSKLQKNSPKKKEDNVDCEVQYKNYAKNIAKGIELFIVKQQQTASKKPFQTGTRKNASVVQKQMKSSRIKTVTSHSNTSPQRRLKTQSQIEVPKKEQICLDFGNNNLLEGEDEIVNNLLLKLKEEEQKYVEEVLTQTELIVKQKMKNYIEKQTEKNEQILFNLKQQLIDKSLNKLQSNKSTIKNGYTEAMKKLVQRGLRGKAV